MGRCAEGLSGGLQRVLSRLRRRDPRLLSLAAAGVRPGEGVGSLGEQARVAEIPLGEFAVATDAKRRVNVEREVEPDGMRTYFRFV